jgi:F-type H+-transporting ATPase subunit epsilon
MAVAEFSCEILTPNRRFFSGRLESLVFTTHDGEYEVLADHDPVVAPVHEGIARLKGAAFLKVAFFAGGFATIRGDKVEILVDAAEWSEEIDVARAEKALERAEKRLHEQGMSWEMARARSAQARAGARLKAVEQAKRLAAR